MELTLILTEFGFADKIINPGNNNNFYTISTLDSFEKSNLDEMVEMFNGCETLIITDSPISGILYIMSNDYIPFNIGTTEQVEYNSKSAMEDFIGWMP